MNTRRAIIELSWSTSETSGSGAPAPSMLFGLCLFGLCLFGLNSFTVGAQSDKAWEVDPYRVSVWMVMEAKPELSDLGAKELTQQVHRYCRNFVGGGWRLVEPTVEPRPIFGGLASLEDLDFESLVTSDPEVADLDKLFVASLRVGAGGIMVEVRELDVATRLWGPSYRREISQRQRLARDVGELVIQSFRPVVRLGTAKGKEINVRMRASRLAPPEGPLLLTTPEDWPLLLRPDDVLQPVQIAKDRHGKPRPGGILPVPWTLLVVQSVTDQGVACQIASGLRYPLRGSSGFRLERIALLARPTMEKTVLRLHIRDHPEQPVRGCAVYAVKPDTNQTTLIGRSDAQGIVPILPGDEPVRILYIRYGDRVMARLPILPGWKSEQLASLPDDAVRLEAEGFVKGIQEQLIDLVVRRKVMAVRIRRRIADENYDEAEQLLDQFRTLTTREALYRQLQDRQQRYSPDDRRSQGHIDRIFREVNSQLQLHLSDALTGELRDELSAAKRGEKPSSPEAAPSSGDDGESVASEESEAAVDSAEDDEAEG